MHFKPFVQQSKKIIKGVLKVTTFKCHIVIQVSSERRICLHNRLTAGGVNDLDLFFCSVREEKKMVMVDIYTPNVEVI